MTGERTRSHSHGSIWGKASPFGRMVIEQADSLGIGLKAVGRYAKLPRGVFYQMLEGYRTSPVVSLYKIYRIASLLHLSPTVLTLSFVQSIKDEHNQYGYSSVPSKGKGIEWETLPKLDDQEGVEFEYLWSSYSSLGKEERWLLLDMVEALRARHERRAEGSKEREGYDGRAKS